MASGSQTTIAGECYTVKCFSALAFETLLLKGVLTFVLGWFSNIKAWTFSLSLVCDCECVCVCVCVIKSQGEERKRVNGEFKQKPSL